MNAGRPEANQLAQLLRGEPALPDAVEPQTLAAAAAHHGVDALLFERLQQDHSDDALAAALRDQARARGIRDVVQSQEDRRVLEALATAGIPALLLKGAALAHSHYPASQLRPRDDTDLLIRGSDRARLAQVMQGLGYAATSVIEGDYVMHQCGYHRDDAGGGYLYDVHWRLSNPVVFSERFEFDELYRRARPLPALGDAARCPCPVDALLYACLHRIAHHHEGERLVWLYDIHLLVQALEPAEVDEVIELARHKQLAAITAHGIAAAQRALDTQLPTALQEFVDANMHTREPGSEFIDISARGRSRWRLLWSDLRALPSLGARLAMLRENLLPPADYLRKQQDGGINWLPWLYLRRALRGAWRLLRHSG